MDDVIRIRLQPIGKPYRRIIAIEGGPVPIVSEIKLSQPADVDKFVDFIGSRYQAAGVQTDKLHLLTAYLHQQLAHIALQVFNEDSSPAHGSDPSENGRAFKVPDVDPWPEAVAIDDVLAEALDAVTRYVYLSREAAVACVLWVWFTHVYQRFDICPYLAILSPLPRCGKSTLLTVLAQMVARPLAASNMTPAAIFRVVEEYSPTLLLDELDSWGDAYQDLRCILNSGHTRELAFVIRVDPNTLEIGCFRTFCCKALASIGDLPRTVQDRSIIVRLDRRPRGIHLDRLTPEARQSLQVIGRKFARWAADKADTIDPSTLPDLVPDSLHDRAADNWRPLLALAAMAGPTWLEYARQAAVALSGGDDDDQVELQLLAAIRDILPNVEKVGDLIPSTALLDQLHQVDDWGKFGRSGRPITPHFLANKLRRFGITPVKTRHHRGYLIHDLERIFNLYLGSPREESATSATLDVNPCPTETYDKTISATETGVLEQKRHTVSPDFTGTYDERGACGALNPGGEHSCRLETANTPTIKDNADHHSKPDHATDDHPGQSLDQLRQWAESHNWPALFDPHTGEELFSPGPEAWQQFLRYLERQGHKRQTELVRQTWSIIKEQKQLSPSY